MADCCDCFEFRDESDSFESWQGLRGPYYTPHVAADGTISWTNNGGLPNPAPVDISGPPGSGVELRGPVASVADLPATAPSGELWLVGAASPYEGYFYNGASWEDLGQIAIGPVGPTGATPDLQIGTVETGEPGSAAEASITGTPEEPRLNLTLPRGQQGPAVPLSDAAPLMDGTASAGTGTSAARADHRHPTDTSRASAATLATFTRPNLLDNWYFVGGGSQLGYGVFPINQRGQTTYSGSGYAIDRWTCLSGNTHTVELLASGMKITQGSGGWPLFQESTSLKALAGKTITFSALLINSNNINLRINSYDGSTYITAQGAYATGTTLELLTVTTTLRNALTNIKFIFGTDASSGAYTTVIATKLEIGNTQTLAHQENGAWVLNEIPNYSDELYKCCTSRADANDTYANKSVQYVEDTGWIDLSSYVNTSIFAIRPGFAPSVRIINGVLFYKGELYITTQPEQTDGQPIIMLTGMPAEYGPSQQISAAGLTYRDLNKYLILADSPRTIKVVPESYSPTAQYYGFSLGMLSGNLQ